ncbi:hypothetical protein [Vulcanisaeta souniana]|nr:hypothetical protein [Vulcanisaeta souniana]
MGGIKGIELIRDFLDELGVRDIKVEFERGLIRALCGHVEWLRNTA